jgi:hypothetical protein
VARGGRQCNGRINSTVLLFVILLYSVSYERSRAYAVYKLVCNSARTPGSCTNAPFVKILLPTGGENGCAESLNNFDDSGQDPPLAVLICSNLKPSSGGVDGPIKC